MVRLLSQALKSEPVVRPVVEPSSSSAAAQCEPDRLVLDQEGNLGAVSLEKLDSIQALHCAIIAEGLNPRQRPWRVPFEPIVAVVAPPLALALLVTSACSLPAHVG